MHCSKNKGAFVKIAFLILFVSTGQTEVETKVISAADAIVLAELHSRALASRWLELKTAKRGYNLDLRRFFPQATISYSDNASVTPGLADTYSKQLALKLTQTISDGGRSLAERQMSRIQLLLQEQLYDRAKADLQDLTWTSYQQVAMSRTKHRLQQRSLELAQQQLAIIELELKQGAITALAGIEAALTSTNLELALARTTLELQSREFELAQLLGLAPETVIILNAPDFAEYAGIDIQITAVAFLALAMKNNLDLKNLDYQIHRKKKEAGILRLKYIPRVTLEASVSVSADNLPLHSPQFSLALNLGFPDIDSPLTTSGSIGAQASGGSTRSGSVGITPLKTLTAGLELQMVKLALSDLIGQRKEKTAELEFLVTTGIKRYQLLRRQLALERKVLSLERQRYQVLEKKRNLGEIKQAELLTAQIALAEKEVALLDRILEVMLGERELEKTAGIPPGTLKTLNEE